MEEEQRETIAFLAEGASYGEPGARVERIDTHCSIVFLVGERAYKLKRAVRYAYLDYSTPALRERACRNELALNRRTAPALYLAVRPICRTAAGSLVLGAEGDDTGVVDWVVEMRRFAQESLFDHLAEARALSPALMRDLADAIAAFHEAAEPRPAFGGSAGPAEAIELNHHDLRLAGEVLDQHLVGELYAASRAALARVADLLERRREAGRVRLCHGDLHLRNICLVAGRPTLFDCIDFNDAFASIDVAYDLAFLLMDLRQRGLGDLASLVLNRYLDRSGDVEALPALPLFMSLRAAIRSHVSVAAMTRQPERGAARRLAGQAKGYLGIAIGLLRPGKPRLVAIGGHSGTGKSTVAFGLAPDFMPAPGARVVRSDVLRKRLEGVAPETRLPPSAYGRAATERVYDAMLREATTALRAGYTAILDATFLDPAQRAAAAATAAAAGVPFTGLWLDAPEEVLAGRLALRRGDASDADLAVLRRQLAADPGPLDWRRIDAGCDTARALAAARIVAELTLPRA